MAQRRMFSLKIIDTDLFLEMPHSTRLLYYELAMRADDDGFVDSPKKILKMVGCNDDDMKILLTKKYIIPFENGVCVIKHWKIHNYIQKDRHCETVYLEEKSQLIEDKNGMYTKCIQNVNRLDTQVRLGEVSLGKVSLGKTKLELDFKNIYENPEPQRLLTNSNVMSRDSHATEEEEEEYTNVHSGESTECINLIWKEYPMKLGKQRAFVSIRKLLKKYSVDEILRAIKRYDKSVKDKKYLAHGSTFFHSTYFDWVDDNYKETLESEKLCNQNEGYNNGAVYICANSLRR